MWWSRATAIGLLFLTAACGFQPLYGKKDGKSAPDDLAATRINIIADRTGQQLRNDLQVELTPKGASAVEQKYELQVKLNENLNQIAIAKDETTSRASLELISTFTLAKLQDGAPLYSGVSRVTMSYNITTQGFATVSAEQDARRRGARVIAEDMKLQLAAYFNKINAGK